MHRQINSVQTVHFGNLSRKQLSNSTHLGSNQQFVSICLNLDVVLHSVVCGCGFACQGLSMPASGYLHVLILTDVCPQHCRYQCGFDMWVYVLVADWAAIMQQLAEDARLHGMTCL
jgi:hypothetical protein